VAAGGTTRMPVSTAEDAAGHFANRTITPDVKGFFNEFFKHSALAS
jgi:hypothetical protein